jgi:multidrug efflux system membrane fusion protein
MVFLSQVADPITRTYRCEVRLTNPEPSFPDGLTAVIEIEMRRNPFHVVSPSVLTLNTGGELGIKALDSANRVRFYPVTILSHDPRDVCLAGLPPKLRIITLGQEYVKAGQQVRPVLSPEQEH